MRRYLSINRPHEKSIQKSFQLVVEEAGRATGRRLQAMVFRILMHESEASQFS
jgi:hypothetical protein